MIGTMGSPRGRSQGAAGKPFHATPGCLHGGWLCRARPHAGDALRFQGEEGTGGQSASKLCRLGFGCHELPRVPSCHLHEPVGLGPFSVPNETMSWDSGAPVPVLLVSGGRGRGAGVHLCLSPRSTAAHRSPGPSKHKARTEPAPPGVYLPPRCFDDVALGSPPVTLGRTITTKCLMSVRQRSL